MSVQNFMAIRRIVISGGTTDIATHRAASVAKTHTRKKRVKECFSGNLYPVTPSPIVNVLVSG